MDERLEHCAVVLSDDLLRSGQRVLQLLGELFALLFFALVFLQIIIELLCIVTILLEHLDVVVDLLSHAGHRENDVVVLVGGDIQLPLRARNGSGVKLAVHQVSLLGLLKSFLDEILDFFVGQLIELGLGLFFHFSCAADVAVVDVATDHLLLLALLIHLLLSCGLPSLPILELRVELGLSLLAILVHHVLLGSSLPAANGIFIVMDEQFPVVLLELGLSLLRQGDEH